MRQIESEFHPYMLTVRTADDRRWKTLHIRQQREIGRGGYGIAYEIDTDVQDLQQEDWIPARFVLKRYREEGQAQRALAAWKAIKEVKGLRTWDTCRISEDGYQLVMTPGNRFNSLCVAADPQSESAREFTMEISLDDLSQIARELYGLARIAADKGLKLPADAYFFLISPDRKKIEVVIGDFDEIEYDPSLARDQSLLAENLGFATLAIEIFLEEYVLNISSQDPAVQQLLRKTRGGN